MYSVVRDVITLYCRCYFVWAFFVVCAGVVVISATERRLYWDEDEALTVSARLYLSNDNTKLRNKKENKNNRIKWKWRQSVNLSDKRMWRNWFKLFQLLLEWNAILLALNILRIEIFFLSSDYWSIVFPQFFLLINKPLVEDKNVSHWPKYTRKYVNYRAKKNRIGFVNGWTKLTEKDYNCTCDTQLKHTKTWAMNIFLNKIQRNITNTIQKSISVKVKNGFFLLL